MTELSRIRVEDTRAYERKIIVAKIDNNPLCVFPIFQICGNGINAKLLVSR